MRDLILQLGFIVFTVYTGIVPKVSFIFGLFLVYQGIYVEGLLCLILSYSMSIHFSTNSFYKLFFKRKDSDL